MILIIITIIIMTIIMHNAQEFRGVPLFEGHQEVRANRVQARILNHESKQVITLEMCCPWVTNSVGN